MVTQKLDHLRECVYLTQIRILVSVYSKIKFLYDLIFCILYNFIKIFSLFQRHAGLRWSVIGPFNLYDFFNSEIVQDIDLRFGVDFPICLHVIFYLLNQKNYNTLSL